MIIDKKFCEVLYINSDLMIITIIIIIIIIITQ